MIRGNAFEIDGVPMREGANGPEQGSPRRGGRRLASTWTIDGVAHRRPASALRRKKCPSSPRLRSTPCRGGEVVDDLNALKVTDTRRNSVRGAPVT